MSEEPNGGRVRPTSSGLLAAYLATGVLAGWLIRFFCLRWVLTEPKVGWEAVGVVAFLAAAIASVAVQTARLRRSGRRLEPHRAVNRLVLGKTCAILGAAAGGVYLGFAIAHIGVGGPAAHNQLLHAALAAIAGFALMGAALRLEHACRVGDDDA